MNNREIKFRFWKPEEKRWVNFPSRNGICSFEPLISNVYTDCNYFIIQQFTGLKDKHSREIYEGDIIQLENAPYKYEVVWNKWHWGIDSKGIVADFIQGFTIAVEERCIVIGNIFENPDLLINERKP